MWTWFIYGTLGETAGKGYGLAKIDPWHGDVFDDLQGHLLRMKPVPGKVNENTILL
jgi:hypothetical protein